MKPIRTEYAEEEGSTIVCEDAILNRQNEIGCDINLEGTQHIFKSEFKHSQATPSHVLKEAKN